MIWYILIGLFVGGASGVIIYFLLNKRETNALPDLGFLDKKNKAIANLQKKKDVYEKEMTEDARREVDQFIQGLSKKKEIAEAEANLQILGYQNQIEEAKRRTAQANIDLKEDYESKKRTWAAEEEALRKFYQDQVSATTSAYEQKRSSELEQLKISYDHKEKGMTEDFLAYSAEVSQKREALTAQIKEYEAQQQAIIERFKKDEEARQKTDFYRIILSESQVSDIKKIRSIAEDLHSPIILYKLIWENFYKNKFSELVGRVAGDKKCGIYKITNIKNQKSYIGQTRQSFKERWRTHVKRGLRAEPTTNNKLYSSMWEDGVENFTFEIICQCTPEDLNEQEKYFISFYNTLEWGYNATGGNAK